MAEPLKLVTPATAALEHQQAAIELLREALADAEAGKVMGVIIVSKEVDGGWYHRASGSLNLREEIGALECLKWDRIAHTQTPNGSDGAA